MKGPAHYHSLPAQDNLVLKRAQSVNKLVSEVRMGHRGRGKPSMKNFVQCRRSCTRLPLSMEQMGSKESNSRESLESNKLNKLSFSKGSEVSSQILTEVSGSQLLVAE